jgi:hypothetical protein
MIASIPQVHLIVCTDDSLPPGPVLQMLDILRASRWQQELVLVASKKWQPYLNSEIGAICIERSLIAGPQKGEDGATHLDSLLNQLSEFDIQEVSVVGELNWGRWILSYFEELSVPSINKIDLPADCSNSARLLEHMLQSVNLNNVNMAQLFRSGSEVYIDPYSMGDISPVFKDLMQTIDRQEWPTWLYVISADTDLSFFESIGLGESVIVLDEALVHLGNKSVVTFCDQSHFAQTSRTYPVALIKNEARSSLFLSGDIHIDWNVSIDFSEIFNILNYWRTQRLLELAFQWGKMGIQIDILDDSRGRGHIHSLSSYSSDMTICHYLIDIYQSSLKSLSEREARQVIQDLRRIYGYDLYSVSFTFKLTQMILERMVSALQSNQAVFSGIGSDHHRLMLAEKLFETIYKRSKKHEGSTYLKECQSLLNFINKIDELNDQLTTPEAIKETA